MEEHVATIEPTPEWTASFEWLKEAAKRSCYTFADLMKYTVAAIRGGEPVLIAVDVEDFWRHWRIFTGRLDSGRKYPAPRKN